MSRINYTLPRSSNFYMGYGLYILRSVSLRGPGLSSVTHSVCRWNILIYTLFKTVLNGAIGEREIASFVDKFFMLHRNCVLYWNVAVSMLFLFYGELCWNKIIHFAIAIWTFLKIWASSCFFKKLWMNFFDLVQKLAPYWILLVIMLNFCSRFF